MPAALAGATDWQYTEGDARRVGLTHGAVNATALACYAASLRQRRKGCHGRGELLAWAGYGLVLGGGYLGGVLTFRHRIGVSHADDELRPREFVSVLPETDLPVERPQLVEAEGTRIALIRYGEEIYAFGDQCAHQGGPLAEGFLDGECIVCPWHGSRFDLRSGRPVRGPATMALSCFEVRVQDGQVLVRRQPPVRTAPPGSVLARRQADDDACD